MRKKLNRDRGAETRAMYDAWTVALTARGGGERVQHHVTLMPWFAGVCSCGWQTTPHVDRHKVEEVMRVHQRSISQREGQLRPDDDTSPSAA